MSHRAKHVTIVRTDLRYVPARELAELLKKEV
jgi:hypothetical protein